MELTPATELRSLTRLDRSLLHVFVGGPGQGEGIAVALPNRGWILVDGCRVAEEKYPLADLVVRFRTDGDDPVQAMVLTHPHADHAEGFAELVELFEPERIVLPGFSESQVSGYRRSWWEVWQQATSYDEVRLAAVVRNALSSIRSWEARTGRSLTLAKQGTHLPLPGSKATATIRAPFEQALSRLFERPHLLAERGNEISLVLEIELGDCRLVLGGDLPWSYKGAPVDGGWAEVLSARPELPEHAALKIPHHGSREAQHPNLLAKTGRPRVWWVTPYNSSGLPVPDPEEGLGSLLEQEDRIHLCAPSVRQRDAVPHPPPGRMCLGELQSKMSAVKLAGFLADAVPAGRTSPMDVLDPIWCAGFDISGNVVARSRGQVALEIVA